MVLHHVCVSHEVKLVVGKGQRLSPHIALLVRDPAVRGYLLKSCRSRAIVHGRCATLQHHSVYGKRPELRSDVQDFGRSGACKSMSQNITQDAIFGPACPETPPNPICEIEWNSRIASDQLENLFEAVQGWALFLHSRKPKYTLRDPKDGPLCRMSDRLLTVQPRT